jgi:hypothetical protein
VAKIINDLIGVLKFEKNKFQAKAAVGSFKEAEETFLIVQSEKIRQDPVFILMLCRCCNLHTN